MRIYPAGWRRALTTAVAVGVFGVSAFGQAGQAPAPAVPPTGLIAGQVVDATSGRPIGDVAVTLVSPTSNPALIEAGIAGPTTTSPSGAPRQVLTNGQGQFVFHTVSKGLHTIRSTMAGYVPAGPGQHRPNGPIQPVILAADDTKVGDVIVRLWKMASITGTVVDEAGEPIVGLSVSAMRRTTVNGQVRFASQGSASTSNRGIYRVAVTPGDYVDHDAIHADDDASLPLWLTRTCRRCLWEATTSRRARSIAI